MFRRRRKKKNRKKEENKKRKKEKEKRKKEGIDRKFPERLGGANSFSGLIVFSLNVMRWDDCDMGRMCHSSETRR